MPNQKRGFFDLPRELRDIIYDKLWKLTNPVAAYHKTTKSGILAYYDGHVLDECELTSHSGFRRLCYDGG